MPATAGRVRMPANNRMQTSASLNTHGIWQNAIGYDPYAGEGSTSASAGDADNTYENMKSLLALARMKQGEQGGEAERGGWKGAGRLKGGWVGGKDLGMIEEPADPNAMPDSTDSESDSDSDDSAAAARVQAQASSAPSRGIEKRKRKKEKKEKKEKKHKKHKKEKKAKKSKKSKKSKGSDSDSD